MFENRTHRTPTDWASKPSILQLDHTNSQIERASIASVDDSIVNLISGTGDSYVTLGCPGHRLHHRPALHVRRAARRANDAAERGHFREHVEFVQSWTDLVRGTDYTYTLADEVPILQRDPLSPSIFIPNPSPSTQTFVLTQIRGDPFGINVRERLIARRQKSIDAYGPRPVIYPSDLISNLEEIRDHLEWAVSLHDGIDGKGKKDLNEVRAVQATINLLDPANMGVIGVGPDSLAEITEPRLGLSQAPFWVDSCRVQRGRRPLRVQGNAGTVRRAGVNDVGLGADALRIQYASGVLDGSAPVGC